MSIHIRRARRTDFAALTALGRWPGIDGSERRSIRLFRSVIADLAYDVYVADDDGETVGYGAMSFTRVLPLGGQRATLEDLAVRFDRRRRGIGRRLVDFLVARAAKRGARALDAPAATDEARAFLERVGFDESAERRRRELHA